MDYIKWINDALERKPHLNQSGLARHLNRHRSVISMMLSGSRRIKADELERIAAYLGEPLPYSDKALTAKKVTASVAGVIDRAWRDTSDGSPQHVVVVPSWSDIPSGTDIFLVEADEAALLIRMGDLIFARKPSADRAIPNDALVIVARHKSTLVNFQFATTNNGLPVLDQTAGRDRPEIVGVVVELRRRF